MERNPPEGSGPVHVPFGQVVANEKWRGSQLAQGMQGRWVVLCINPLFLPYFLKTFYHVSPFHLKLTEFIFLSAF